MLTFNYSLFTKAFYIHAAIGLFLALASFSHTATAYPAPQDDVEKLSGYIDKVCKKGCVEADRLLQAVTDAAKEYRVNPVTLLAIIRVESSYKPLAENKVNGRSVGLSQIQIRWHRDKFRTIDPFDITDNVRVGAKVYKDCVVKHKGDRSRALACYSGNTEYSRTKYVPKVLEVYGYLQQFRFSFARI